MLTEDTIADNIGLEQYMLGERGGQGDHGPSLPNLGGKNLIGLPIRCPINSVGCVSILIIYQKVSFFRLNTVVSFSKWHLKNYIDILNDATASTLSCIYICSEKH